ncbi:MAG: hypothetical protein VB013_06520 [Anaerolineaceae bacterium]|nr:hypothetical protein [Anaerolineaceae bacterium]
MTSSDERLRVLKLIEEGKISASEAVSMLDAASKPENETGESTVVANEPPRYIHVLVTDMDSGKARVNIRMPINLVNTGIKMGAHLSTEINVLDTNQINDYIKRGVTGQVLDVMDDDEGERVQIFLEK